MKREKLLLGISWFAVACLALLTGTIEYELEGTLLSRQLGYVIAVNPSVKMMIVLVALLFLFAWLWLRKTKQMSRLCWFVPLTVFFCELLFIFSPTNQVRSINDMGLLSAIVFNPLSISFFLQGILLVVSVAFGNRKGSISSGIALLVFGFYFVALSNQMLLCHSSPYAIRVSSCIVCVLPAISIFLLSPCHSENEGPAQCSNLTKVHALNRVFTCLEWLMVIALCYLCMLLAFDPLPIPTTLLRIINAFVCLALIVFPVFLITVQKRACQYMPHSPQNILMWKGSIGFILLSCLLIPVTIFRIVCEDRLVYTEMILFFPLAPCYFFAAIFLLSTTTLHRKKPIFVLLGFLVGVMGPFCFLPFEGLLLCVGSIIQYLLGSWGFFLLRKKGIEASSGSTSVLRLE